MRTLKLLPRLLPFPNPALSLTLDLLVSDLSGDASGWSLLAFGFYCSFQAPGVLPELGQCHRQNSKKGLLDLQPLGCTQLLPVIH